MTLSITTLNLMTLSLTKFSIKIRQCDIKMTLKANALVSMIIMGGVINAESSVLSFIMLSVVMLNVMAS